MGDLDNFKSYNDTYGHHNGDECLKKVASEIQQVLKRTGDFCARYGGEEFILILPHTDREGARQVAEAIRARIQGLHMAHKNALPLGIVTMSFGVSTMDAQTPFFFEDLINAADQTLYRAKQGGRNRVDVWEGNPE